MINRQYCRQTQPSISRRSSRIKKPVITFLLLTIALLIFLHFTLDATIRQSLEYQGKIIASEQLAQETLKTLQEMKLSYGDLVTVTRDGEGKLSSIETNMDKVNQLKNQLETNVTGSVNGIQSHTYSLPLGTLLGNDYLMGRGPEIPLQIRPMGYMESTVESRFRSAGINQTNHQLVLNLRLDLTTLVPLHHAESVVTTNVILAETVIVGEVPEYYTNITGEEGTGSSTARDLWMNPWDASPGETK